MLLIETVTVIRKLHTTAVCTTVKVCWKWQATEGQWRTTCLSAAERQQLIGDNDLLAAWVGSNRQSSRAAGLTTLSVWCQQLLRSHDEHACTMPAADRASHPAHWTVVKDGQTSRSETIWWHRQRMSKVEARIARQLDAHTPRHNEDWK